MKKFKIVFPLAALIIAIAIVLYMRAVQQKNNQLPALYNVPAFSFTDHDAQPFTLDNLKGRISIVDFIFTNCGGLCPMMASKMLPIHDKFKNIKTFQIVSFSVDPERDSTEALQQYAKRYEITDKIWRFIRTDKQQIDRLYEHGFKLGGELPYGHSGAFVLVDQQAIIRGYYNSSDEESLAKLQTDVTTLLDGLN